MISKYPFSILIAISAGMLLDVSESFQLSHRNKKSYVVPKNEKEKFIISPPSPKSNYIFHQSHYYPRRSSLFFSSIATRFPPGNGGKCSDEIPLEDDNDSVQNNGQHKPRRRVFVSPQRDPPIPMNGQNVIVKLKGMLSFIANQFVSWLLQRKKNVNASQDDGEGTTTTSKKNINLKMLPSLSELQDATRSSTSKQPSKEVIIDTTLQSEDSTLKPSIQITERIIKNCEQLPSFLQQSSSTTIEGEQCHKNSDKSTEYGEESQYQSYVRGNSCHTLHVQDEKDVTTQVDDKEYDMDDYEFSQ